MNLMKSGLFCSKPFTWFEVSRGARGKEGDVFLCCPTWLNTTVGNLNEQSVQEIWNGTQAQEIRQTILDGSFSFCDRSRCFYLQSVSGPVSRIEDVTEPDFKEIIEKNLTSLPYGPQEVNCSYDRSCNLSCPSCRTELIVDWERKDEIEEIQSRLSKDALPHARLLYVTGSGDPFGSPHFRKWLQTLKASDMPKMKVIHLHTNAQLFTRSMWESLSEDVRKLVRYVDVSIDAAKAQTYLMNRRGGKFEVLLENLAFIKTLRKEGPLSWFGINMVVQENNFREMVDFVTLGKRFEVDTVYFHQLADWGTYGHEEYLRRAIHLQSHPSHEEFVEVLQHEALSDPMVELTNLSAVKPKATSPESCR